MKPLSLLLAASLIVGVASCGKAGTRSMSSVASTAAHRTGPVSAAGASNAVRTQPTRKTDRDGDSDGNDDDYGWGRAAGAADRRAARALLERYYAAAAASDGAKGCALIYSLVAEDVPELYGQPPSPPALRGNTCAQVMSKMFKLHHAELTSDHATLKVIDMRIEAVRAIVIMSFKGMPQRDILVHREGKGWRIQELLDSNLG